MTDMPECVPYEKMVETTKDVDLLAKKLERSEKACQAAVNMWSLEKVKVASLTEQCEELMKREDGWMDAILELQEYCSKLERGEVIDSRPPVPWVVSSWIEA